MVSMLMSLALLAAPATITCKDGFKLTYVGLLPKPSYEYSKIENIDSSNPEMTQVEFRRSANGRDDMKARFSEKNFSFGKKKALLRRIVVSLSPDAMQNLFAADMALTGNFTLKCTRKGKDACMIKELFFGQPRMAAAQRLEHRSIIAEVDQIEETVKALQKDRQMDPAQMAEKLSKIKARLEYLYERKKQIEKEIQ